MRNTQIGCNQGIQIFNCASSFNPSSTRSWLSHEQLDPYLLLFGDPLQSAAAGLLAALIARKDVLQLGMATLYGALQLSASHRHIQRFQLLQARGRITGTACGNSSYSALLLGIQTHWQSL